MDVVQQQDMSAHHSLCHNSATPHAVPSVAPWLLCVTQHPIPAITNGVGHAAMTMPHVEVTKVDGLINAAVVNGPTPVPQPEAVQEVVVSSMPSRPKSQNQLPYPAEWLSFTHKLLYSTSGSSLCKGLYYHKNSIDTYEGINS